ncbi:hypothetical protein HPB51_011453 [Rhipicephalus microplus]|uniref:Uncharacterized protein n=1 Tax=Rhipicephalus microplus TaxID=6941 RepID=A0A9J6DUA4_RHIMP|nr:hypothetical protein HPB51_011453 [Rhipicephalus microplus]
MAVALCEIDEDCYSFRRERSCWQKDWVGRKELGVQNLLYKELLKTDHEEYRRLLRVSREQFLQLLSRVETRIRKKDTVMRQSISAETRLQVTLRYLASVINASPERVTAIVNAACVRRNFLGSDMSSAPDSCAETSPAVSMLSVPAASRGRIGAVGAALRDKLCCFFNDKGAVPWQWQSAHLDVNIYRRPRQ